MNDAKDVDFPDPVGPVHNIRPLCIFERLIKGSGNPISFQLGILSFRILIVRHLLWFEKYAFTLNLAKPSILIEGI